MSVEIRKVEAEIEEAKTEWLKSDSSNREFWREELKALREEESKLREEKNKLIEQKSKLIEQKSILLKTLSDSGGEFLFRRD